MKLIDRAKNVVGGLTTLYAWLGDGGETVDQATAQKRTEICIKCPLNQAGPVLTEAVAKAIKAQIDLRNELGLRTAGIKSLRTCKACSCFMPLKIWVPLERILPDEDEKKKLDKNCWLLEKVT